MVLALWQHDWLLVHFGVGKLLQKMIDAVEPRTLLVDCLYDPPPRFGNMGALQHDLLRFGVVLPATARLEIHGAQLPLPQRIMDTTQEPQVLFFVRN